MQLNLYRYDDAQVLLEHYSYEPAGQFEFRIVLTDDHPFDINQYLLPFAIVVGICFVIMLVIVIYKCIQVLIIYYIYQIFLKHPKICSENII